MVLHELVRFCSWCDHILSLLARSICCAMLSITAKCIALKASGVPRSKPENLILILLLLLLLRSVSKSKWAKIHKTLKKFFAFGLFFSRYTWYSIAKFQSLLLRCLSCSDANTKSQFYFSRVAFSNCIWCRIVYCGEMKKFSRFRCNSQSLFAVCCSLGAQTLLVPYRLRFSCTNRIAILFVWCVSLFAQNNKHRKIIAHFISYECRCYQPQYYIINALGPLLVRSLGQQVMRWYVDAAAPNVLKGLQLLLILMLNGQTVNVFNIFAVIKSPVQSKLNRKPHNFWAKKKTRQEKKNTIDNLINSSFHTDINPRNPTNFDGIDFQFDFWLFPIPFSVFISDTSKEWVCAFRHDNLW